MSLIRATHYVRDAYEPCFMVRDSRVFGSERAAELWAKSLLETTVTTRGCYHRDVARAPYVRIGTVDSNGYDEQLIRYIEPKVELVPSVGELGYW